MHVFLSTDWIAAAREIHSELRPRITEPDEHLRMNVTVIDAPLTDGTVIGHVDTTTGSAVPREGHIDDAEVAVRVPWEVARLMLIEQQFDQLLISFMSGEIEVEGDVTLLMTLQDLDPTPDQQAIAAEVAERLRGITA